MLSFLLILPLTFCTNSFPNQTASPFTLFIWKHPTNERFRHNLPITNYIVCYKRSTNPTVVGIKLPETFPQPSQRFNSFLNLTTDKGSVSVFVRGKCRDPTWYNNFRNLNALSLIDKFEATSVCLKKLLQCSLTSSSD